MSETTSVCACCGWRAWWRNPSCVQVQPPEFVIDDGRPDVLRAPRVDDFEPCVTLPCGHRVLGQRPCPTCAAFADAPDDESF